MTFKCPSSEKAVYLLNLSCILCTISFSVPVNIQPCKRYANADSELHCGQQKRNTQETIASQRNEDAQGNQNRCWLVQVSFLWYLDEKLRLSWTNIREYIATIKPSPCAHQLYSFCTQRPCLSSTRRHNVSCVSFPMAHQPHLQNSWMPSFLYWLALGSQEDQEGH